jgi:Winged helix-turn helix
VPCWAAANPFTVAGVAELNITPQKPLRRGYERDPEAVARWERETYPGFRRRAGPRAARDCLKIETVIKFELSADLELTNRSLGRS